MSWQYFVNQYGNQWMMPLRGFSDGLFGFLIVSFLTVLVWSLIWKGLALWKAARKGDKLWFVIFLLVNTLGILEILYLYVFRTKEKKEDDIVGRALKWRSGRVVEGAALEKP